MASTTNADGTSGGTDLAGHLTRICDRTNLMVLDATLNALPKDGALQPGGFADAAAEVRALARRMLQTTQDFQATICEAAE
ncbi:hypothetical protein [Azospirillum sp. sgz302134]